MSGVTYYSPDGEIFTAENVLVQTNNDTQDGNSKNKNSPNKKMMYKLVKIHKLEITSDQQPYNLSAD